MLQVVWYLWLGYVIEWINCISAQRKLNLCAPGAPKGPKVGMSVRQYEILCANDAGRAPRKYPAQLSRRCSRDVDACRYGRRWLCSNIKVFHMISMAPKQMAYQVNNTDNSTSNKGCLLPARNNRNSAPLLKFSHGCQYSPECWALMCW